MAKILYQGHGSLRLMTRKGTVVYIDPYAGEGYDVPADAVLVTHEHMDHNKVELVEKKASAKVFRPENMLQNGQYRTIIIDDVVVMAAPAGNNPNHDINKCVGYLISADDFKVYVAGDTSTTDYMKEELPKMNLDYAFLPIDGMANMGPEEAEKCALAIKSKHTVPYHMAIGSLFDMEKAKLFQVPGAKIVLAGQEFELCHGCSGCGNCG